jgi:hypothetical protein
MFVCYLSDDAGATWRESRTLLAAPAVLSLGGAHVEGLEEPGVVGLADGRLFAWARTSLGRQFGTHSADGGETWSAATPTALVSPNAPLSMKRAPAPDGRGPLLAVWTDHSGRLRPVPISKGHCTNRWPLVSAVSRDEGRTWESHTVLDDEPGRVFSYVAIHFPDDRHALFAYWVQDDAAVHGGFTHQRVRRVRLTDLGAA